MAVTSSAISSSSLFHQSPPSSISSSCYSSVSPISLKSVTAHQGTSSTPSSRLSVSASSGSSSSLPASRRKSSSTACDNATPRSSSSSAIDFLTLCHRLKVCICASCDHGKVLDGFFLSTAGKFQTDVGKRWAAEVASRGNKRRLSER